MRRIVSIFALCVLSPACTELLPGSDVLELEQLPEPSDAGDAAVDAAPEAAPDAGPEEDAAAVCPPPGMRPTRLLMNEVIAEDTHLSCAFDYELDGHLLVTAGTLRIDPGVTLRARAHAFVLVGRAARLDAQGTPDAPILFTAAERPARPGAWRGLFLLGLADAALPNSATLGLPSGDARGFYGGSDDAHDCGVLRDVRVEFAGGSTDEYDFPGAAVTLAGCGKRTRVESLHVHAATDGIGLVGGSVPLKRVLVTAASADGIEWTAGYRGFMQFVVVQSFLGAGAALKGSRLENDETTLPASAPVIFNATLIGAHERGLPGGAADANGFETGVQLQAGTRLTLRNGLVLGFAGAWLDVIGEGAAQHVGGDTQVTSTIFAELAPGNAAGFPGGALEPGGEDDDGGLDENALFRQTALQNRFPAQGFALLDPAAPPPRRPRFGADGFVDGGAPADSAPAGWEELWEPAFYAGALPKLQSEADAALDWTCGELACALTAYPEE